MISITNLIRFCAIVGVTAVAINLLWKSDERRDQDDEKLVYDGPEEPDAFIFGGTFTAFNKQGQLLSRVTSEKSYHYPETDSATLQQPIAHVFSEDGTPWQITADQGVLRIPQEQMDLNTNVRVEREDPKRGLIVMETESVTLDNRARFITTREPVKITDPATVITAVGMDAYIDQKKVELISEVRGSYAKPQKQ